MPSVCRAPPRTEQLTLGDDLVQDGAQFRGGDLHVLDVIAAHALALPPALDPPLGAVRLATYRSRQLGEQASERRVHLLLGDNFLSRRRRVSAKSS